MNWQGEGIVLSARRHGETSMVVEILTAEHGRHLGMLRGGRSRRLRPVVQPGNSVQVNWRARLSDHLGNWTVEPVHLRAGGLMDKPLALAGLAAGCALCSVLPERQAYPRIYREFSELCDSFSKGDWRRAFVRWEMTLLSELGFGLDFSACDGDPAYVSPRTGAVVGREKGDPHAPRLFPIPAFLSGGDGGPVLDGLRLTGYFLKNRVYGPLDTDLPPARRRFAELLERRA